MESTTLVTFMLHHPAASYIELWGSWDNFAEPWEMKRDSRRGWGHWSGCHKFRNIICDGDSSGFHEKRDGGLKMGGTYWYYYRIDGTEEYYDPSQPSTSSCPLLPGQYLNVLEVPWEKRFVSRSRSSSVALITEFHTLNPDARFRNPRPVPKPRLPRLMTKLDPNEFRAWSAAPPETPDSTWGHRPIKSASSVPANFFTAPIKRSITPVSARLPGVGSRGRSIRLRPSHPNLRQAFAPEVRVTNPVKPDISYPIPQSWAETEELPVQPPKRHDAFSRTVDHLLDGHRLDAAIEIISDPFVQRPIATAPENFSFRQPIHRRAVSHESAFYRSTSRGRSRDPSPLRSASAQEIHAIPALNIPDSITEVDTPPRAPARTDNRLLGGLNLNNVDLPTFSLPDSRPKTPTLPNKLDLNKELPALPTYLYPSPLFSHSVIPDPEEADPSPFVLDWTSKQSRFSSWTMASDDAESSDIDGHDGLSSTFSDIQDSGHTSPLRFSDPFWLSLSESEARTPEEPKTLPSKQDVPSREQTPLGRIQPLPKQELSPMEQLMDEFEYLGAALI